MSMLTDLFLENRGVVPTSQMSGVLSEVCVPLAGRRIIGLQMGETVTTQSTDALMIEFELCIGLIFKPFRYHLKMVEDEGSARCLPMIWKSVLQVLEDVFQQNEARNPEDQAPAIPKKLKATMHQLANEHLQSAVTGLINSGVLLSDGNTPGDISDLTWTSIGKMGLPESAVAEWREKASRG